MESKAHHGLVLVPPLLALPREIRDLIYDELLSHGSIDIGFGVVATPVFGNRTLTKRFHQQVQQWQYELQTPRLARLSWELPLWDVLQHDTWTYPGKQHLRLQLTYQAISTQHQEATPTLNLQTFLLCKQIYNEARETFYNRNIFRFRSDFRIPTALHFLQDRPAESRSRIRSMVLALTEEYVMIGRPNHTYPITKKYTVMGFKLRYSYEYYNQLCSTMANTMNLQYLGLVVETFRSSVVSMRQQPHIATMQDCLAFEEGQRVESASWIEPLAAIRSLRSISLRSISDIPMLTRHAAIAETLRDQILQKDSVPGNQTLVTQNLCPIELLARLHRGHAFEVDDPDETDFMLNYDVATGELNWRACRLHFDQTGATEVVSNSSITQHFEEEENLFADYGSAVICSTKLQME
ncbi:hypothetical protein BDV96DRAFT_560864 [Lophiotrema nucula]|uniref:DUF7730 domain-containing protein n=1 Tax=Lophiotrema nucula TaxID=690887 RepID=A0A6A5ZS13_9PLEO|nr:hypothetical protein BDV96DRAFT_560864 [Lophiotrema nucula]